MPAYNQLTVTLYYHMQGLVPAPYVTMQQYLNYLPQSVYPFIWSDYAELQALASHDYSFSERAFIELILHNQECACAHPAYTEEDAKTLWQQLITHCCGRSDLYAGHYPFVIDEKRTTLTLELVKFHPKQRLYLGMVIAASLRHLPPKWHDRISLDFAQTCHQLFINLMPEGTTIQRLPASLQQFPPYEQIEYIANMVRGKVLSQQADYQDPSINLPSCAPSEPAIKPGIVDLLAWHPMGDTRDGIPVAIGRCDCISENWTSSQQILLNLNTQIYARHPWATYHFSPIDLYTPEKDWALKNQLGRVILLDRLRILNLAEEYFIYNDVPDIDHIEWLHERLQDQV